MFFIAILIESKEYRIITNIFEYWIYYYINIYVFEWDIFFGILIPNGSYSLVLWFPNQWGLFIDALIPNQWGLFIGILISKQMGVIHWYFNTQPIWVIHWYSDTQSQGYSVTIVIKLLRIWIIFEYLNYFESLKLHMWIWKCLSIWTIWVIKTAYVFLEPIVSYSFWYMENWLFSKPSMINL